MAHTCTRGRRVATSVVAAGLLIACDDESTAPTPQPQSVAPTLSAIAFADMSGAIVQLPFIPEYGAQQNRPTDVNDRGDVVGTSWTFLNAAGGKDDTERATFWPADGSPARALPPMGGDRPGLTHSQAHAVNSRGDVVGTSGGRATLWPADGGPPRELMAFGVTEYDAALDINDRGDVIGFSGGHSTLWPGDGGPPRYLGKSGLRAINNRGDVLVGTGVLPAAGGPTRMLTPLDGYTTSVPAAMNDHGDVVGYSSTDGRARRATLWPAADGMPRDLGTLGAAHPNSIASGINNRGEIVGVSYGADFHSRRATLWVPDGRPPVDLGVVSGGVGSVAVSISSTGYVAGYGLSPTSHREPWDGNQPQDVGIRWAGVSKIGPALAAPVDVAATTDAGVCSAGAVILGAPVILGDPTGVVVVATREDQQRLEAPYARGVTTVVWTATDAEGISATATQRVTVRDAESPLLTPPPEVVAPADPGLATATVQVGLASATDNCDDVTATGKRGDAAELTAAYPVGTTVITWSATDGSGNMASTTQSVVVSDREAPVLGVPAGIVVNATAPDGAKVKYVPTASDNVGVTSLSCSHPSGVLFPAGATAVACTAADPAGNSTSKSFTVTVLGAPEQLAKLSNIVQGAKIVSSYRTRLLDILASARASVHSAPAHACKGLDLFVAEVSANTGTLVPADKAARMIADAGKIKVVIACDPTTLPPLRLRAPMSVLEGSDYTISVSGTGGPAPLGKAVEYALDCGQGAGYGAWSNATASVTCPAHLDQLAAPLTVRGKARLEGTGEREFTQQLEVKNAAPVVTFAATTATTIKAGETVSFRAAFTDAGVNDGPWTWRVVWGDFSPSTRGEATAQGDVGTLVHTYATQGTREAYLSVTDKDGKARSSAKITITVLPPGDWPLVISPHVLRGPPQISGLTMQDNTSAALYVMPVMSVSWSSDDPTGSKATLSTTGVVSVRHGNDDIATANEVVITATGLHLTPTVQGTIRINSFSFDHYPRTIDMVWRPIAGAAAYEVVVDRGHHPHTSCIGRPDQCTEWTNDNRIFMGPYSGGGSPPPWFRTELRGAYAVRWHVVGKDLAGAVLGRSEYVYFSFVR